MRPASRSGRPSSQRRSLLVRCPRLPLPLCSNSRCSFRPPRAQQRQHLCRRSLEALPSRTTRARTRTPGQGACCAARPTSRPSPRRQAPTRSSKNRCRLRPAHPTALLLMRLRLTGFREQQRPQLALHAGLGGHEGVGCRLLHRWAAHVKPPPRDEAARCSHIQPDGRCTFQA